MNHATIAAAQNPNPVDTHNSNSIVSPLTPKIVLDTASKSLIPHLLITHTNAIKQAIVFSSAKAASMISWFIGISSKCVAD